MIIDNDLKDLGFVSLQPNSLVTKKIEVARKIKEKWELITDLPFVFSSQLKSRAKGNKQIYATAAFFQGIIPAEKAKLLKDVDFPEDLLSIPPRIQDQMCWETRKGEQIQISAMEDGHLERTILFLSRRNNSYNGIPCKTWYQILTQEQEFRKTKVSKQRQRHFVVMASQEQFDLEGKMLTPDRELIWNTKKDFQFPIEHSSTSVTAYLQVADGFLEVAQWDSISIEDLI